MSKSINRRTVIKGTAATLVIATVGIPALAKAQLDPVAKAHKFIQRADALDFRYFVHGSGALGFREGSNISGRREDTNWPEFSELMKNEEPPREAMIQALGELGRVEPPFKPIDISNWQWVDF